MVRNMPEPVTNDPWQWTVNGIGGVISIMESACESGYPIRPELIRQLEILSTRLGTVVDEVDTADYPQLLG